MIRTVLLRSRRHRRWIKRGKKIKRVFLAGIAALLSVNSPAHAGWKVPFSVTSGGVTANAVIGMEGGATSGYDPGRDIPVLEPGEVMTTYFSHPEWGVTEGGDSFTNFYQDIKGETSTATWELRLNTTLSYLHKLSWIIPTDFPHNLNLLISTPDGGEVDMKKVKSYSFNSQPSEKFTIKATTIEMASMLPPVITAIIPKDSSIFVQWQGDDPDIAGYKMHFGRESGKYERTIPLGKVTNLTIKRLVNGTTYFVAVSAYNDSGIESAYSIEESAVPEKVEATAPTTTASPAGGTYTAAQTVTLTCDDGSGSGCDNIYYTTDGSTPTISSAVYGSAINISATKTLKFFAKDTVGNEEAVKTEVYTINEEPDTPEESTPPVTTITPSANEDGIVTTQDGETSETSEQNNEAKHISAIATIIVTDDSNEGSNEARNRKKNKEPEAASSADKKPEIKDVGSEDVAQEGKKSSRSASASIASASGKYADSVASKADETVPVELSKDLLPATLDIKTKRGARFSDPSDVNIAFDAISGRDNSSLDYTATLYEGFGIKGEPLEVAAVDPSKGYGPDSRLLKKDTIYTVTLKVNDGDVELAEAMHTFVVSKGTLAGDVDYNGVVDGYDLILMLVGFGKEGEQRLFNPYADLKEDGLIDRADLELLDGNFGNYRDE